MSTFAQRLAVATGAEWVEIDRTFWQPGLSRLWAIKGSRVLRSTELAVTWPVAPSEGVGDWEALQEATLAGDGWIADGDLGPYDAGDGRRRWISRMGRPTTTSGLPWRAGRRRHCLAAAFSRRRASAPATEGPALVG